jgi:hypothetical protein
MREALAGTKIGHRIAVVVRGKFWEPIVKMVASRSPNRRFEVFRFMDDTDLWAATAKK